MKKNSIFILLFVFYACILVGQKQINYAKHIRPIMENHCTQCHTKNNIAPFPLTSYEDVKSNIAMIKYTIEQKLMPPFKADNQYHALEKANQLNQNEIDLLYNWIEQGCIKGNEKKREKSNHSIHSNFQFDTMMCMSESFEQYGIYYDQYMTFTIPYHFHKDRMVESIEFIPGNKKIVKHAIISIDTSDAIDALDRWDPRYGYYTFNGLGFEPQEYAWFDWSPGDQPNHTFYKNLPKKSKIILSLYYGPTGMPQSDSSCIKLKFSEKAGYINQTKLLISEKDILNDSFYIPAQSKKFFLAQKKIEEHTIITEVLPMANLICGSFEIFAKSPDNKIYKILKIQEWDFHWQRNYKFLHPVTLPKGTILSAYVHYNNTDQNLNNVSNPPVDISEGNHMYKEQLKVYFTTRAKI